jgi:hypothetical protein
VPSTHVSCTHQDCDPSHLCLPPLSALPLQARLYDRIALCYGGGAADTNFPATAELLQELGRVQVGCRGGGPPALLRALMRQQLLLLVPPLAQHALCVLPI